MRRGFWWDDCCQLPSFVQKFMLKHSIQTVKRIASQNQMYSCSLVGIKHGKKFILMLFHRTALIVVLECFEFICDIFLYKTSGSCLYPRIYIQITTQTILSNHFSDWNTFLLFFTAKTACSPAANKAPLWEQVLKRKITSNLSTVVHHVLVKAKYLFQVSHQEKKHLLKRFYFQQPTITKILNQSVSNTRATISLYNGTNRTVTHLYLYKSCNL